MMVHWLRTTTHSYSYSYDAQNSYAWGGITCDVTLSGYDTSLVSINASDQLVIGTNTASKVGFHTVGLTLSVGGAS